MIQAMARLGNPAVANPIFSDNEGHPEENTLGKGLSDLYFKIGKQKLSGKIILLLINQRKYEGLIGYTLNSHKDSIENDWKMREKNIRFRLESVQKTFLSIEEKDIDKLDGGDEDIQLAKELIRTIKDGDLLAAAALWYPAFFSGPCKTIIIIPNRQITHHLLFSC